MNDMPLNPTDSPVSLVTWQQEIENMHYHYHLISVLLREPTNLPAETLHSYRHLQGELLKTVSRFARDLDRKPGTDTASPSANLGFLKKHTRIMKQINLHMRTHLFSQQ
ncbi:hypothetical protein GCM10023187_16210 [Nibrella viscosa]|uniref:Uncharacterized protein n=1 Tax=Nibrella viscosa TaxID=1084524 RepID=A0ABP8K8C3_9BACT